jgi:hypothetical protein
VKTEKIEVSDSAVTALVRDIINREKSRAEGQASYLRTLIAAVQTELGIVPRMAARGRVKPVTAEEASTAINTVHGRFYALVLAELDQTLDAQTRNAQSGFARSTVSTLRAAVRLGLNPLELVIPTVSKGWLRQWAQDHKPEADGPMPVSTAEHKAKGLVKRLAALIEPMSAEAKAEILVAFHLELAELDKAVRFSPEKLMQFDVPKPRLRIPGSNGHQQKAA